MTSSLQFIIILCENRHTLEGGNEFEKDAAWKCCCKMKQFKCASHATIHHSANEIFKMTNIQTYYCNRLTFSRDDNRTSDEMRIAHIAKFSPYE